MSDKFKNKNISRRMEYITINPLLSQKSNQVSTPYLKQNSLAFRLMKVQNSNQSPNNKSRLATNIDTQNHKAFSQY